MTTSNIMNIIKANNYSEAIGTITKKMRALGSASIDSSMTMRVYNTLSTWKRLMEGRLEAKTAECNMQIGTYRVMCAIIAHAKTLCIQWRKEIISSRDTSIDAGAERIYRLVDMVVCPYSEHATYEEASAEVARLMDRSTIIESGSVVATRYTNGISINGHIGTTGRSKGCYMVSYTQYLAQEFGLACEAVSGKIKIFGDRLGVDKIVDYLRLVNDIVKGAVKFANSTCELIASAGKALCMQTCANPYIKINEPVSENECQVCMTPNAPNCDCYKDLLGHVYIIGYNEITNRYLTMPNYEEVIGDVVNMQTCAYNLDCVVVISDEMNEEIAATAEGMQHKCDCNCNSYHEVIDGLWCIHKANMQNCGFISTSNKSVSLYRDAEGKLVECNYLGYLHEFTNESRVDIERYGYDPNLVALPNTLAVCNDKNLTINSDMLGAIHMLKHNDDGTTSICETIECTKVVGSETGFYYIGTDNNIHYVTRYSSTKYDKMRHDNVSIGSRYKVVSIASDKSVWDTIKAIAKTDMTDTTVLISNLGKDSRTQYVDPFAKLTPDEVRCKDNVTVVYTKGENTFYIAGADEIHPTYTYELISDAGTAWMKVDVGNSIEDINMLDDNYGNCMMHVMTVDGDILSFYSDIDGYAEHLAASDLIDELHRLTDSQLHNAIIDGHDIISYILENNTLPSDKYGAFIDLAFRVINTHNGNKMIDNIVKSDTELARALMNELTGDSMPLFMTMIFSNYMDSAQSFINNESLMYEDDCSHIDASLSSIMHRLQDRLSPDAYESVRDTLVFTLDCVTNAEQNLPALCNIVGYNQQPRNINATEIVQVQADGCRCLPVSSLECNEDFMTLWETFGLYDTIVPEIIANAIQNHNDLGEKALVHPALRPFIGRFQDEVVIPDWWEGVKSGIMNNLKPMNEIKTAMIIETLDRMTRNPELIYSGYVSSEKNAMRFGKVISKAVTCDLNKAEWFKPFNTLRDKRDGLTIVGTKDPVVMMGISSLCNKDWRSCMALYDNVDAQGLWTEVANQTNLVMYVTDGKPAIFTGTDDVVREHMSSRVILRLFETDNGYGVMMDRIYPDLRHARKIINLIESICKENNLEFLCMKNYNSSRWHRSYIDFKCTNIKEYRTPKTETFKYFGDRMHMYHDNGNEKYYRGGYMRLKAVMGRYVSSDITIDMQTCASMDEVIYMADEVGALMKYLGYTMPISEQEVNRHIYKLHHKRYGNRINESYIYEIIYCALAYMDALPNKIAQSVMMKLHEHDVISLTHPYHYRYMSAREVYHEIDNRTARGAILELLADNVGKGTPTQLYALIQHLHDNAYLLSLCQEHGVYLGLFYHRFVDTVFDEIMGYDASVVLSLWRYYEYCIRSVRKAGIMGSSVNDQFENIVKCPEAFECMFTLANRITNNGMRKLDDSIEKADKLGEIIRYAMINGIGILNEYMRKFNCNLEELIEELMNSNGILDYYAHNGIMSLAFRHGIMDKHGRLPSNFGELCDAITYFNASIDDIYNLGYNLNVKALSAAKKFADEYNMGSEAYIYRLALVFGSDVHAIYNKVIKMSKKSKHPKTTVTELIHEIASPLNMIQVFNDHELRKWILKRAGNCNKDIYSCICGVWDVDGFPRNAKSDEMMNWLKLHASEQEYRECQRSFSNLNWGEFTTTIPMTSVSGARVLDPNDKICVMLGQLTNCCQKRNGVGEDCMLAGLERSDSTFMIFERGREVIAQAWIWESKGTLVLDNIEFANDRPITSIIPSLVEWLKATPYKNVQLGTGYCTDLTQIFNEVSGTNKPQLKGYKGYTDAEDRVWLKRDGIIEARTRKVSNFDRVSLEVHKAFNLFNECIGPNIITIGSRTQKIERAMEIVKSIEKEAYPIAMQNYDEFDYEDLVDVCDAELHDIKIMHEDNWYVILVEDEDEVEIVDFACKGTVGRKIFNIMKSITDVIDNRIITGDMRESTSYRLVDYVCKKYNYSIKQDDPWIWAGEIMHDIVLVPNMQTCAVDVNMNWDTLKKAMVDSGMSNISANSTYAMNRLESKKERKIFISGLNNAMMMNKDTNSFIITHSVITKINRSKANMPESKAIICCCAIDKNNTMNFGTVSVALRRLQNTNPIIFASSADVRSYVVCGTTARGFSVDKMYDYEIEYANKVYTTSTDLIKDNSKHNEIFVNWSEVEPIAIITRSKVSKSALEKTQRLFPKLDVIDVSELDNHNLEFNMQVCADDIPNEWIGTYLDMMEKQALTDRGYSIVDGHIICKDCKASMARWHDRVNQYNNDHGIMITSKGNISREEVRYSVMCRACGEMTTSSVNEPTSCGKCQRFDGDDINMQLMAAKEGEQRMSKGFVFPQAQSINDRKEVSRLANTKFSTCDISNYISHFDGVDTISETIHKCNEWLEAKEMATSQLFRLTGEKTVTLWKDDRVIFSFNIKDDETFRINILGAHKYVPAGDFIEIIENKMGIHDANDMHLEIPRAVALACILLQPISIDDRKSKHIIRDYHKAVIANLSMACIDDEVNSNNPVAVELAKVTRRYVVHSTYRKMHTTALTVVKNYAAFNSKYISHCISALFGFKSENGYMHGKYVTLEDLFTACRVGAIKDGVIMVTDIQGNKTYARLKNITSAKVGRAMGYHINGSYSKVINLFVTRDVTKFSISGNTWFFRNAAERYKVAKDWNVCLYQARDYKIAGFSVEDIYDAQVEYEEFNDEHNRYEAIMTAIRSTEYNSGDIIATTGKATDHMIWDRRYSGRIDNIEITPAAGADRFDFDVKISMTGIDCLHDGDKIRLGSEVNACNELDINVIESFIFKSVIVRMEQESAEAVTASGRTVAVHAITGPEACKQWALAANVGRQNGLFEEATMSNGVAGYIMSIPINIEQPGSESRRNERRSGINFAYFMMEKICNPDSQFVRYLERNMSNQQYDGMSIVAAVCGNLGADIDWIKNATTSQNLNPWHMITGKTSVDMFLDEDFNEGMVFTHDRHNSMLINPIIVPPARILKTHMTYISIRDLAAEDDDFNVKCGLTGSEHGIKFMQRTTKLMSHLCKMANDRNNRLLIEEAELYRREWRDEAITSRNMNNWGKFNIPAINGTVNGIYSLPPHLCVAQDEIVEQYRDGHKDLYVLCKRFPHIEPFMNYLKVISISEYNDMAYANGWIPLDNDPGSGSVYISDYLADILNFDSDGDRVFWFIIPSKERDLIGEAMRYIRDKQLQQDTEQYCRLWADKSKTKFNDLKDAINKSFDEMFKMKTNTCTIDEFISQCKSAVDNKVNTARYTMLMIRAWEMLQDVISAHIAGGGQMLGLTTKLIQNALDGIKDKCINAYSLEEVMAILTQAIVDPGNPTIPTSNISVFANVCKEIGMSSSAMRNDVDIMMKANKMYREMDKLNKIEEMSEFARNIAGVMSGKNAINCYSLYDSLVHMKGQLQGDYAWYHSPNADALRRICDCAFNEVDMMPITFMAEAAVTAIEDLGVKADKLKFERPTRFGGITRYRNPLNPAVKSLAIVDEKNVLTRGNADTIHMSYDEKIEYIYANIDDSSIMYIMSVINKITNGKVNITETNMAHKVAGILLMAHAHVNSATPQKSWLFKVGTYMLKDCNEFNTFRNNAMILYKEKDSTDNQPMSFECRHHGVKFTINRNDSGGIKYMPQIGWNLLQEMKKETGKRYILASELAAWINGQS